MLNRIVLMGRLTRDPELRYTPSSVAVCTITLAVERDYAAQDGKRECDFIDVVCWRQNAEFVAKYFKKGQLVAAEGRVQARKWVDKDGRNRVTYEVAADRTWFAERMQEAAPAGPGTRTAAPYIPAEERVGTAGDAGFLADVTGFDGFADPDDDVPF